MDLVGRYIILLSFHLVQLTYPHFLSLQSSAWPQMNAKLTCPTTGRQPLLLPPAQPFLTFSPTRLWTALSHLRCISDHLCRCADIYSNYAGANHLFVHLRVLSTPP